jgi:hypothetical protein
MTYTNSPDIRYRYPSAVFTSCSTTLRKCLQQVSSNPKYCIKIYIPSYLKCYILVQRWEFRVFVLDSCRDIIQDGDCKVTYIKYSVELAASCQQPRIRLTCIISVRCALQLRISHTRSKNSPSSFSTSGKLISHVRRRKGIDEVGGSLGFLVFIYCEWQLKRSETTDIIISVNIREPVNS